MARQFHSRAYCDFGANQEDPYNYVYVGTVSEPHYIESVPSTTNPKAFEFKIPTVVSEFGESVQKLNL